MSTLYELTENMLLLQRMLDDDEIDEVTFADTMGSLELDLKDKADGYAKVLANMQGYISAMKAEEDRLANRRRNISKKIDYMKDNLKGAFQATGTKKMQTELFTFSLVTNPPSVVIDDEKLVPKKYIIKKPQIDKVAIKEALKQGVKVRSCRLESGESLRIK